jgi:putative oxidoreductase
MQPSRDTCPGTNTSINPVKGITDMVSPNLSHDAARVELGAFVLRVSLGVMFIAHAGLKYFVFTLPGTAQFFVSLGLPAALAYFTFGAELIGGILLVLGVYSRYVALALVPILLGATWAHIGNGWTFSAPNGGWEYPAFLSVAAIVQFLIGDGVFSLRRSETANRVSTRIGARAAA